MADVAISSSSSFDAVDERVETVYSITRDTGPIFGHGYHLMPDRPFEWLGAEGQLPESAGRNTRRARIMHTRDSVQTPLYGSNIATRDEFTQWSGGVSDCSEDFIDETFSNEVQDDVYRHHPDNSTNRAVLTCSGSFADDWIWPQPTHLLLREGIWYPMCQERIASKYTLVTAMLNGAEWSASSHTIAELRSFIQSRRILGHYQGPNAQDASDLRPVTWQWTGVAGVWSDGAGRLYHDLDAASFGANNHQRSLVWGLPPICMVFHGSNTFSFSDPGDKTLSMRLVFGSAVDSAYQSTTTIFTHTIPAVNCTGDFWVWGYGNKSVSLSAVSVPSEADFVTLQRKIDGPGGATGTWSSGGTFLPWAPIHYPFAIGSPGGRAIPGVMRRIL